MILKTEHITHPDGGTEPKKPQEGKALEATAEFVTRADGWTAGKWRAKGTTIELTATQAKYENVLPKADWDIAQNQLAGSIDGPATAETAGNETAKRGRSRK